MSRLYGWRQAPVSKSERSASQVVALMGCNSMRCSGYCDLYLFCPEPPGDAGMKQLRFAEEGKRTIFLLPDIIVGQACLVPATRNRDGLRDTCVNRGEKKQSYLPGLVITVSSVNSKSQVSGVSPRSWNLNEFIPKSRSYTRYLSLNPGQ